VNVKGTDGVVRVAPEADRATMTGAPPEPPQYGTMRNVVIKMYGSQADESAGNVNMTLTMTNAAFDNDTFRIFTEEYVDENGKVVHADEVPVTVRAKQYDFDGSGLVLYWNDLDRRLKSLEIEHGTQFTIYDSGQYQAAPISAAEPAVKLVDASETLPAGAISAASEPTPESVSPKHRYLATFYDDVRIEQNGVPLIRAPERMEVDFAPREGGANPATAPDVSSPAQPTTSPAASSSDSAETTPSSPAAQQPIQIYWKGKMEMVPTDETTAEPLAAGESIVRFFGDIVRLRQRSAADGITTEAVCSELIYHTADSSAKLTGSPGQLVQIHQTKEDGSTTNITGPLVLYSRGQGIAMVQGPGSADLPDEADAKGAVHAVWDKSCIVHLDPNSGQVLRVKTVDLSGHVAVDHPKFNLMSDDLGLVFVPGAPASDSTDSTAPQQLQLGQVLATGNAVCVVHESEQRTRSISSDKLQLNTDRMPDGRLFAKTILADGSVHALQDQETLGAEHLRVNLLPANAPDHAKAADSENQEGDVQLDTLEATENVRVTGKNSTAAAGNRLTIVMVDGHPKVTLFGTKDQPAIAADKDSTISGPEILLSAADQTSSVQGAGTLSTTAQAAAAPPAPGADVSQNPPADASKARPIKLSWAQSADLDGKANLIRVLEDVNVESKDASGTLDLAHADELNLTLADTTATPGAAHPASSEPADIGGAGDFNFMRNKQVQSLILIKKAQIESSVSDAAGKLLRRSDIFSDRIEYNVISRKLLVPQAGRMLVEDHRPAAAGDDPNSNPVTGRGVTAFKWDKELYYDEAKRTAEISGGVVIVHRDDGPKPNPIHIDADTASAEFQPSNPDDPQSDDASAQLQIGHLTVAGHVTVVTESATIRCGEADYDPVNFQLVCSAADEEAATLLDAQHDNAEFSQIVIDTKTNLIVKAVNVSMHHHGE
jgi:hypothetical protein